MIPIFIHWKIIFVKLIYIIWVNFDNSLKWTNFIIFYEKLAYMQMEFLKNELEFMGGYSLDISGGNWFV